MVVVYHYVIKNKNFILGTFTGNAATTYGLANKVTAKEQLEQQIKQKYNQLVQVIFVVKILIIVALPNGIVKDHQLVEIKCTASAKKLTSEEAITRDKIKLLDKKQTVTNKIKP